jgi:DNA replication and repair protein RecF
LLQGQVTAICGLNGIGKTNLLDAVHYLCFTKSYFGKTDSQTASIGMQGFNVSGKLEKLGRESDISLILRENGKKELWVDKEQISPFSRHIGSFPVVFIAPDDIELITGGSEYRRKMIDTILSQLDATYLAQLIRYNKSLADRNRYLKETFGVPADGILLDALDAQLVQSGSFILNKRNQFLAGFIPKTLERFEFISSGAEYPQLQYLPNTSLADYESVLKSSRQRDIAAQRTLVGIHRDDLDIKLQGLAFKQVASQGQKKSMLFALKLAEFSVLHEGFGFEPILLLDDIFEKLDGERLKKLLQWVCIENKGQVILTDTDPERVEVHLKETNIDYQMIKP